MAAGPPHGGGEATHAHAMARGTASTGSSSSATVLRAASQSEGGAAGAGSSGEHVIASFQARERSRQPSAATAAAATSGERQHSQSGVHPSVGQGVVQVDGNTPPRPAAQGSSSSHQRNAEAVVGAALCASGADMRVPPQCRGDGRQGGHAPLLSVPAADLETVIHC